LHLALVYVLKRRVSSIATVFVCLVIADGKHSYMDLSPEHHFEHVIRPPVSSRRWSFSADCHSHSNVSSRVFMSFSWI